MLKKLFFLFIVFVGFNLNAQDYSIRGFVYDDGNMEPISDIKIKLLKQDSSVIAGAYTNLNGGFLIPKLSKGAYILKVEVGGFKKSFVNVEITEKQKIYDVQFYYSQFHFSLQYIKLNSYRFVTSYYVIYLDIVTFKLFLYYILFII